MLGLSRPTLSDSMPAPRPPVWDVHLQHRPRMGRPSPHYNAFPTITVAYAGTSGKGLVKVCSALELVTFFFLLQRHCRLYGRGQPQNTMTCLARSSPQHTRPVPSDAEVKTSGYLAGQCRGNGSSGESYQVYSKLHIMVEAIIPKLRQSNGS